MNLLDFNLVVNKKDKLEKYFNKLSRFTLQDSKFKVIIDLPNHFNFNENDKMKLVIRDGLDKTADVSQYGDIDNNHKILKKYKYVLYGKVYNIDNDILAISCGGLIVCVFGKISNLDKFYIKQDLFILIN